MPDWTASMKQTFEYYTVDPNTWGDDKLLTNVTSSSISRDLSTDTIESASLNITETLEESYVRIYLITIQNGVTEKHALGTFLVQTPSVNFNGMVKSSTADAYSPLIELKEKQPPIGYSIMKNSNVMDYSYRLTREAVRAPVVDVEDSTKLYSDFVSDPNDTWYAFISDLLANAKKYFMLDEMSRILFAPKQDIASLQPVWDFDDGNSSILYPDIEITQDLFGIPNVVEVIYSNGGDNYFARVVNNDSNSPLSTVNRGREIVHRVTNPDLMGDPTNNQIKEYAEQLLKELSSVEFTVSFTHGYCPVRLGDCVRLNYERAGITDVKARVISQSIKCEPGCPVTTKAVFTTKFWR